MKNKIVLIATVLTVLCISCKKNPADKLYPTDGLISYFNFDDNLSDQMGNTPDGTNHGGATFTPGKAGNAITVNGSNQYIQFDRKTYRSGNNISVALWIKRSTAVTSGIFLLVCNDFAVFSTDVMTGLAISVPGTDNAEGPLTQNVWVHLVGTYDGTNIKAYINGVLTQTKNHPGTISGLDEFLKLGMFNTNFWGGSVDDLFIYNKVLSQAEVTKLYDYH